MKNQEKSFIQRIEKLKQHFDNGDIPTLVEHEVNPGLPKNDRINYIYFTLPVSINFQRSSPTMWQSALKTYEDPETNYLFYPEKVVTYAREKIQSDLLKHKLGLQKNKHTDIWIRLSTTFHEFYNDDPREFFKQFDYDVVKIIMELQIKQKKNFPFLSGLKLSNYWLYILSKYSDAIFQNKHEISIIPDTHIIQATKVLGLTKDLADSKIVEAVWKEALSDANISPVELHPVLWNWSRNNFKPEV